jgi:uncharacterized protein YvpB
MQKFIHPIFIMLCMGAFVLSSCVGETVALAELGNENPTLVVESNTPNSLDSVDIAVQISSTPQPTATLRPSSTLVPSSTPIPSFTPVPSPTPIPESVYLKGVNSFRQSYAISCESRTAVDWADFFGVQIYESDFQFGLPLSDNPNKGFVGNVHDPWGQVPPYSYGVHAAPVATLLKEEYGLPARAATNFSLENLKKEIASGQPVIAWVIGNMVGGIPSEYTDKEGEKVIVAAYEHTVIVTGYGKDHIRYLNNGKFYQVPVETFLNSWGVLGNMLVYHKDASDRY